MPFISEILKHKSLSIVGMEKNTGKTECLNYIIGRLKDSGTKIAITSIGIDGETVDQVTKTHKPEIEIYPDTLFTTSENHYRTRRITSEILNISKQSTSLGRLVTARAKSRGKLIFSGPTNTMWIKDVISEMKDFGSQLTIIDGALSRKSLGSPSVTDCMILSTGAAVSHDANELIRKTKFVYNLINIEEYKSPVSDKLVETERGIWAIDDKEEIHDLGIDSTLLLENKKDKLFEFGTTIFASGIVTDKVLNLLRMQKEIQNTKLIVKDFTRIFVTPESLYSYLSKGGKIKVLLRTKLIAVCVNPTSPSGYIMNSEKITAELSEALNIPVYDIFKEKENNFENS
ncbi:MAG: hypothetical protein J6T48_01195 [Bacteroidales bacterium]|nr:hypothetical protein [Bacteroidales bacterium]